jgi:hypothetical protein
MVPQNLVVYHNFSPLKLRFAGSQFSDKPMYTSWERLGIIELGSRLHRRNHQNMRWSYDLQIVQQKLGCSWIFPKCSQSSPYSSNQYHLNPTSTEPHSTQRPLHNFLSRATVEPRVIGGTRNSAWQRFGTVRDSRSFHGLPGRWMQAVQPIIICWSHS